MRSRLSPLFRSAARLGAGFATCVGGATLIGCTGGVSIGVGAAFLVAWPLSRVLFAGAPPPCDREGANVCVNGRVQLNCCERAPDAPGCKPGEVIPPFVGCGNRTCVEGADQGRCDAPDNRVVPGEIKDEAACNEAQGYWNPACVGHKVETICVPRTSSNYTGPSPTPRYRLCGPTRCTTHVMIEDCYPTPDEATSLWPITADRAAGLCYGAIGLGQWQKVCLSGAVSPRCVPLGTTERPTPVAPYVTCPDGSCAVGTQAACPQ